MNGLGAYTAGFQSWRKVLASVPPDVRLATFEHCAAEVCGYVSRGLDRVEAADGLREIAVGAGMLGSEDQENAVQEIIARAFENIEQVPDPQIDEAPQAGYTNGRHAPQKDKAQPQALPVVFPFPILTNSLPRRPWIVPGLMMRRQVTLMVAPPGSGKSLLTLQLGMVCAAGLPEWNRWKPRGRYRVLIINVEEDEDEMRRRLGAAAQAMALGEADLSGLCIARINTLVVAKADSKTKTVIATPMLHQIVRTIIEHQIDIVVVDPFAETFAGDENSNSELKWAAVLWRDVARKTNSAVFLVHHAKKYAQHMAGDMDAARGGGALSGVARIVSTLFAMTGKEATAFAEQTTGRGNKFNPDDRHRYIRYDDAKANFDLISPAARWFKKESISLDNAGDDEPADQVGVLIPWQPPNVFESMNSAEANAILDLLEAGVRDDDGAPTGDPFSFSRKGASKRWCGLAVQQIMQCTDDDAKKILRTWLDNGVIEEFTAATTTSKGKLRSGVRVVNDKRPGRVIDEVIL